MSKITREQVEKAIEAKTGGQVNDALMPSDGSGWLCSAPDYVGKAWEGKVTPRFIWALVRWHDALEAAERAQAEPVCPEGVKVEQLGAVSVVVGGGTRVSVAPDGGRMYANGYLATAALLRYAADLSEYRARKHAEGDRQRKLDAVRAAEEAAEKASQAAIDALGARDEALRALQTARREAGQ